MRRRPRAPRSCVRAKRRNSNGSSSGVSSRSRRACERLQMREVGMRRGYTWLFATGVVLLPAAWPRPAQADCPSPPLIDSCLVGSWKQTGGGGEWMRQNLKMAQPTAAPSDGTLTFNADGTFSTSKVDSKAEVTAPGTSTRATGQMKCASERDVVGGGRHAYAVHDLRRLEGQHRDRRARGQEDEAGYAADEARNTSMAIPAPAPRCRPPSRCPRTPQ